MKQITAIAALLLYVLLTNTEGALVVEGVYDCDVPKEGIPKGFVLKTSFINGVFSGSLKLPFTVDENITVKVEYHSYKNEKWVNSQTTIFCHFCDTIELYAQKLWTKLTDKAGVQHNCPYLPGNYSVEEFTATESDLDLELTGTFHNLYIFTMYKDDVPIACKQIEVKKN